MDLLSQTRNVLSLSQKKKDTMKVAEGQQAKLLCSMLKAYPTVEKSGRLPLHLAVIHARRADAGPCAHVPGRCEHGL